MKHALEKSAVAFVLAICVFTVTVRAQSPATAVPTHQQLASPSDDRLNPAQRNDKVKSDVLKMVADARAGRTGPPAAPQFPLPQRNNLSKTAKIAIVAGIVLVIVAIVIVHGVKNVHCESRCVI
ncbi:MAG TPA: hypothetical protein VN696_05840 [Pyrinomonadaceae bacterium]|nr:hypothetical protein [Pyrinomonadaceae bacterium]